MLARMLEIDGHPMADHGLHLAQAPILLIGMTHQGAGFDEGIEH